MNITPLNVERRELKSKGYTRQLRRSGLIPGVLYGKGGESTPIQVTSSDFGQIIHSAAGTNALINVTISGEAKPQLAMIKEVARDVLHANVIASVDFVRVSLKDKVEVSVPLAVVGNAVNDNGLALLQLREVTILSSPVEIPDSLNVDITGKKIGDTVTVADLSLPNGVEAVTPLEEVVLTIQPPRLQEAAPEEETVEEPVEQ